MPPKKPFKVESETFTEDYASTFGDDTTSGGESNQKIGLYPVQRTSLKKKLALLVLANLSLIVTMVILALLYNHAMSISNKHKSIPVALGDEHLLPGATDGEEGGDTDEALEAEEPEIIPRDEFFALPPDDLPKIRDITGEDPQ